MSSVLVIERQSIILIQNDWKQLVHIISSTICPKKKMKINESRNINASIAHNSNINATEYACTETAAIKQ